MDTKEERQIKAKDDWNALCQRLGWRCSACNLPPAYEDRDDFIVTGKCGGCFAQECKGDKGG
jgi:hypothetical protein